ncbi:hypothetical protein [Beijerinckia indica]|uniref:Uncharacterized protein n=1 Tax=Beijerinckia indica subsp. indica (strain ATCC 9039 / DSM 1715 / NCIMB 8712) TaxID=395963 RepID=B2IL45_BEII9|nr:hypothetical protein [Beijerinckia indica]ACB97245.1 hypothetical protein Bind_3693 [Beijerinckia indica subsp. indica ATCC 9039]
MAISSTGPEPTTENRLQAIQMVQTEQTAILGTLVKQNALILELLTPPEMDPDRVPLDKLLTDLVRQSKDQLNLLQQILKLLQMGRETPAAPNGQGDARR